MDKLDKVISTRVETEVYDLIEKIAKEEERRVADMARLILKRWLKENGYLHEKNDKPGSSQKKAAR